MTSYSDQKQWCELFYETGRGDGRLEGAPFSGRMLYLGMVIGFLLAIAIASTIMFFFSLV